MAQGIILAGGYSSRIGQNKMSLIYQGMPLIHHAIQTMSPFVTEIFVITGHYHDELMQLLSGIKNIHLIYNENYPYGMFSSVKKGAMHVYEDFFILPGDYPIVKPSTYEALLNTSSPIAVPVYQGKRGHPIFLRKALIKPLIEEPLDSNLKIFRNRYEIQDISVDDEGILIDIDTINDHEQLIKRGVETYGN